MDIHIIDKFKHIQKHAHTSIHLYTHIQLSSLYNQIVNCGQWTSKHSNIVDKHLNSGQCILDNRHSNIMDNV